MENSNKNILQTSLADRSSQNSTVSGFPIQQRTIGARSQLTHLLYMKCEEVVLKQRYLETSTHKKQLLW